MERTQDEARIRELVENWARAVRNRDLPSILAHHSQDIVMYDVPPPIKSVGIDAYRQTWNTFFSWSQDLAVFDIIELHIVAGQDVAFCFAEMKCAGRNERGEEEALNFRLTIGLKKNGSDWEILHEHHSLPA